MIKFGTGGWRAVIADEFTRNKAVGKIIKLLKYYAAEKGKAEFPNHSIGLSYR